MAKFLTIGYGDQSGYDVTPEEIRNKAHDFDAELVKDGRAMTSVLGKPIQVRNHQSKKVERADGSFMKSDLPVAGFSVLEAKSLDEAVALCAQTPCAIANGIVEIWPIERILK